MSKKRLSLDETAVLLTARVALTEVAEGDGDVRGKQAALLDIANELDDLITSIGERRQRRRWGRT